MAKTKKARKKTGGAKTDFASKKTLKKLAKKVDDMGEDIGAAHNSDRTLGERLDQGLETLANDLRKVSTGIEAHVNAVKFEAAKQVEAAKSEAAREMVALKADMAKQIDAAKAESSRLVASVKAEAAALLAEASKASEQAIGKLKDELAQARAELEKAAKSAKAGKPAKSAASDSAQRPVPARRPKATATKAAGASAKTPAKTPAKRRRSTNSGASKGDTGR